MVKVKICGITNLKDAKAAISAGAWAVGFIFYKKSPRYISPKKAREIIAHLPLSVHAVGVFVNEKEQTVKKIADECCLDILQFHGDESPGYCKKFKGNLIIKAFRVKEKIKLKDLSKYKVDGYLFDTFQEKVYGGSGKTFNWEDIKDAQKLKKPVILSGGLSAKNIKEAIQATKPYAVDISSGVERSPGLKSEKLIKDLISQIRRIKPRFCIRSKFWSSCLEENITVSNAKH